MDYQLKYNKSIPFSLQKKLYMWQSPERKDDHSRFKRKRQNYERKY